MVKSFFNVFGILLIGLLNTPISAQNFPLGTWQSHLPYNNAVSLSASDQNIYCGTIYAVFSYSLKDGSIKRFSKAEGLSDVGVSAIAYDTTTSSLVIAYNNSNLDILQKGKVINLPFIRNANILGDKQINRIYCKDGWAFLATGFGVVAVNLQRLEIPASYFFSNGGNNFVVNDIWVNDDYIYAATANGIYRGQRSGGVNLVNFQEWESFGPADGIPISNATAITGLGAEVYASVGSTIYQFDGNSWMPFYTMPAPNANAILKTTNRLIIAQDNRLIFIPNVGVPSIINETFFLQRPQQVIETASGELWYADLFRGLIKFESAAIQTPITPNGPPSIGNSQMDYMGGKMYVGSSPIGRGWTPTGNQDGYYVSESFIWTSANQFNVPALVNRPDISVMKALPGEGIVVMGSHFNSIIEFKPGSNEYQFIQTVPNSSSPIRISGAALDNIGNLWMSNAFSAAPIICRKAGGGYLSFSTPLLNNRLITGIAVDDFNQVWIVTDNSGLVVLNYGNTLEDKSDDQFLSYTSASGGLPTNAVTSIATDQTGQIWVGSTQGVSYIPCPGNVFDRGCSAQQICIPRNDGTNFCDLLLETELITTILVDEANRKWFGTTNGLFLQSEDGLESIYYFNEANSPLLSNVIRNLAINPETGDLLIGTERGISSFRAEATRTTANNGKPFAYPNPVRPNYDGPIAVKNLPNNALVKVTDVSGKLIWESNATGGQFIWDGRDREGRKVNTGIYYIMATSSDNKEKAVTKLAIIR
jgi:hypothetical protein